ncbi:MAG: HEPN domain-containing protein [Thermoproteota archaeon]
MPVKIDPEEEIAYRLRMARRYLEDAEAAYIRRDYRTTVSSSQSYVENATKAVIAYFKVPSWSHDPSVELRELIDRIPKGVRSLAEKIATYAQELAPEHGRSIYGEPSSGLTPWELYSKEDAGKSLRKTREALQYAYAVLERLKTEHK